MKSSVAIAISLPLLASCATASSTALPKTTEGNPAQCIAVLPFLNHSGYEQAGQLLAEVISNQLITSWRNMAIMEPGEALRRIGISTLRSEELPELYGSARNNSVELLLLGTVHEYGHHNADARTTDQEPRVSASLELHSAHEGRMLWKAVVGNFERPLTQLTVPRAPTAILMDLAHQAIAELTEQKVVEQDLIADGILNAACRTHSE